MSGEYHWAQVATSWHNDCRDVDLNASSRCPRIPSLIISFTNVDAWEMRDAIRLALECYQNPDIMAALIDSAMRADFGFDRSAEQYARLYIDMLEPEKVESGDIW